VVSPWGISSRPLALGRECGKFRNFRDHKHSCVHVITGQTCAWSNAWCPRGRSVASPWDGARMACPLALARECGKFRNFQNLQTHRHSCVPVVVGQACAWACAWRPHWEPLVPPRGGARTACPLTLAREWGKFRNFRDLRTHKHSCVHVLTGQAYAWAYAWCPRKESVMSPQGISGVPAGWGTPWPSLTSEENSQIFEAFGHPPRKHRGVAQTAVAWHNHLRRELLPKEE
jgi:hypothetical protein